MNDLNVLIKNRYDELYSSDIELLNKYTAESILNYFFSFDFKSAVLAFFAEINNKIKNYENRHINTKTTRKS